MRCKSNLTHSNRPFAIHSSEGLSVRHAPVACPHSEAAVKNGPGARKTVSATICNTSCGCVAEHQNGCTGRSCTTHTHMCVCALFYSSCAACCERNTGPALALGADPGSKLMSKRFCETVTAVTSSPFQRPCLAGVHHSFFFSQVRLRLPVSG